MSVKCSKFFTNKLNKISVVFFLIASFFIFLPINYAQTCPEGFFWCGGKLCFNSTVYDKCCGQSGYNSLTGACCYYSKYSDYNVQCNYPNKCCGEICIEESYSCCNEYKSLGCKRNQQCCEKVCCEKDEECCEEKCCQFGYTCNRKYNPRCVMTYDFRFLFIPIGFDIVGFVLLIFFINEKFCAKKLKKVGILNEENFSQTTGNHSHNENIKEYNPERFFDYVIENKILINTKKEFEICVLGFIHKTFYKSSIIYFFAGSIPSYIMLLNRDLIMIDFLVLLILIFRLFGLFIVLRGKSYIKISIFNFCVNIYSIIVGIVILIILVNNNDSDRIGFRIISILFCMIFSFFPIQTIKMEIMENNLIIEAKSGIGGSGKDQFGNTKSASSFETLKLKIPYPNFE